MLNTVKVKTSRQSVKFDLYESTLCFSRSNITPQVYDDIHGSSRWNVNIPNNANKNYFKNTLKNLIIFLSSQKVIFHPMIQFVQSKNKPRDQFKLRIQPRN